MPEDNDEDENRSEDESVPIDDLFDYDLEERRDAHLEHVSFDDCKDIRKGGQLFRESDANTPADAISIVSDKLGVGDDRGEWVLRVYTTICTTLETAVSGSAATVGRGWYAGKDLDKLEEEDEENRSRSDLQQDIRAFTGSFIEEGDVEDIEIDREIPDSVCQPYSDLVDNINFTLPTIQYPSQITALATEITRGPRYTDIIEEATPDLFDFPVTHSMAPVIDQIQIEELVAPLMDIQPIVESIDTRPLVQESVSNILEVFAEENFGLNDEFASAISEAASTSTTNWDEQAFDSEFEELDAEDAVEDIDELDSETVGEDVERETYTEEGSRAIVHVTNINHEAARGIYLRWWTVAQSAAATAAEETGSRISDTHLAIIASVAATLMILTGRLGVGIMFLFHVISILSDFGRTD